MEGHVYCIVCRPVGSAGRGSSSESVMDVPPSSPAGLSLFLSAVWCLAGSAQRVFIAFALTTQLPGAETTLQRGLRVNQCSQCAVKPKQ